MNENVEKVQKVVEMTGVSYADAKEALEQAEWDVLSAVISLEEQGKAERRTASYSTATPNDGFMSDEMRASQDRWQCDTRRVAFSEGVSAFGRKLRDFLWIQLYIERDGEQLAIIPMFLVIVLLALFRSFALVAVIVSLFFGIRYRFEGLDAVTIDVNGTMDRMADMADSIVNDEGNGTSAPTEGFVDAVAEPVVEPEVDVADSSDDDGVM